MIQPLSVAAVVGLMAATAACGTPANEVVENETAKKGTVMTPNIETPSPTDSAPINKRFASLDDYLSWLRQMQAPVDGSWYEEVGPGLYKLNTGNLRVLGPEGDETPPERTYTRAELEKKFGFDR